MTVSQAAVAGHLGLSTRALRDLIARGILPKAAGPDEARRAYIDHLRAVAAGRAGSGPIDGAAERARLDRAKADREELRLARERAEVIEVAEVTEQWGEAIDITKGRMLALPGRLAAELFRCKSIADVEQRLHAAMLDLMRELAEAWQAEPEED